MRYIILFLLFFVMLLLGLAGMCLFMDIDYTTQIAMHFIPIVASLIIVSIILFATTKSDSNRPRTALIGGFVWAILLGIFDYVFLTNGFIFLSKFISLDGFDGYLRSLLGIFDSIPAESFYKNNLIILILRYATMFLCPFIFSLFVPPKENTGLPMRKG